MPTIRTFIAIELPSPAQTGLSDLQNRLKTVLPPRTVRWVPAGNIHLTIHFLGDIPTGQTDTVTSLLQAAAAQIEPFSLQITGLGCFPHIHRPRVIWAGVQGQTTLLKNLHKMLGDSLQIPTRQLKQLAESLQRTEPEIGLIANIEVTTISFMQSQLKPTGAIYTRLEQGICGA